MKYSKLVLIIIFIQVSLFAQMAGNPAGAQGGEWTVSASTSTLKHVIGHYKTESQRHLIKSAWGLGPMMDFYVMGGGVQLEMESSVSTLEPYKGKFRLGIGTGLKLNLLDDKQTGFGLWIDAHMLRFSSRGSYKQFQSIGGTSFTRQFKLYYDWREFRGNVGITLPIKRVKFYAAGSVFNIWRKDQKDEYLIDTDHSKQLIGEANDEYKSGFWTGGLAGIEVQLPDQYRVSVEVLGFNKENYQILVGISQTGISQW